MEVKEWKARRDGSCKSVGGHRSGNGSFARATREKESAAGVWRLCVVITSERSLFPQSLCASNLLTHHGLWLTERPCRSLPSKREEKAPIIFLAAQNRLKLRPSFVMSTSPREPQFVFPNFDN